MRTEEVLGRLFSANAVLTAVHTHKATVAERLEERYRTAEDPQSENVAGTFSYQVHIDNLSGELDSAREHLASSEDAHQRKLAVIDDLVRQREELIPPLSQRFFQVRHTVEGLFGPQRVFALANVAGNTPQSPQRLVEQATQTVAFLRDPAVEMPSHGLTGAQVDFGQLAEDLETPLDELKAALAALARARKESDSTLAVKQQAVADFNGVFRWVSNALESLFHLAGLHVEAERIRPSVRRPGRRAVDEEAAPEEPFPEPGSGEPSPEPSEPTPADA